MTDRTEKHASVTDERSKAAGVMWFAIALLLAVLAGFGLRHGTSILDHANVRDEDLMKVPIDDIVNQGWSVDTAINYQEVKGPAFIWPYALGGSLLGNEINDLRLITTLFFIGAALPLLLIMWQCGLRGPSLVAGVGLYVLLPYNAMVSQMLMSEPSFIFIAMWMMWVFLWGFGSSLSSQRRVIGPVLFGLLLSALLHHRPHAVAFAGAVALVSFERDGWRSWPWWLACLLAGLSRLPLWMHWGGLVTSDYQGVFTMGFRLEPITYLFAASLPLTWLFLWRGFFDQSLRSRRWWIYVGGATGLVFGLLFRPDVFLMSPQYTLPGSDVLKQQQMYAGTLKTALRTLAPGGMLHVGVLVTLATLGGAAIGAMLAATWSQSILSFRGVVMRASFWTLVGGIGLFMLTGGPVYDRYLQVWAILLPIIWLWSAPRWLVVLHGLLLAAMAGHLVLEWLN